MPPMTTVLVSGAGVAGPVLAYWLRRCGFATTVVERRPALGFGDGGHPVDLFGPAVEIVGRMGLLDAVQAARTRTRALSLVRPGHRTVDVDLSALVAGVSSRHVEIFRGELVRILYEATRDEVEYVFGDTIAGLTDTGTGVEGTFASGVPRTFDLVVGADGLHSGVRRLVFGDVPGHFLGGYLGVFTVPYEIRPARRLLTYLAVDHMVGLYEVGSDGRAPDGVHVPQRRGARVRPPRPRPAAAPAADRVGGPRVGRATAAPVPGRRRRLLLRRDQPDPPGLLVAGTGDAGRRRRLLPGAGRGRRHQPGGRRRVRPRGQAGRGRRGPRAGLPGL